MKNKTGIYIISLLIFLLTWFITTPDAYSEHLIGSGCSVSNVGYLTELAKEYERRTGVKVFVRGGGTVIGIEDLRNGKVDFAASCRTREEGDPEDIEFIQVAWDALVFIVHKTNPVSNISIEDVRAIYAGKITNWKQLKGKDAPIKIFISRPRKGLSGVEASTKALVLKGLDPVETPNTMSLASSGIVEQMVEETAGGFATTGFTSARKRDVKMLKVKGVLPTSKNIINKNYPLKRPLFILIPKKPRPEAKKLVDFVLSRDGQNFIRTQGVVSLSDVK
ncbi:MAG: phosphate ABC transporter substrate-binding protein [Thermodesulfovibrionales bacterium]